MLVWEKIKALGRQMACAGGSSCSAPQPPGSERVVCLLLWGHRAWLSSIPTSPVLCMPAGGKKPDLLFFFFFSKGFLGWVHRADLLAASASPSGEGNREAATASGWSSSRGSGSFWRCKQFFFPMGWLEKKRSWWLGEDRRSPAQGNMPQGASVRSNQHRSSPDLFYLPLTAPLGGW